MKKPYFLIYSFLTLFIHGDATHISNEQGFTLITSLYNETNDIRINEYLFCMEQNLQHPAIDTIHVVYDTSKDSKNANENKLLNYLKNKNVNISYIDTRATYGFCFNLANTLCHNKKIILTNADIYFNDTLNLLLNYDLTNKFLALTRWNVGKDDKLTPHASSKGSWFTMSQDAWIFNSPLKPFKEDNIGIGTMHCDGQIAYQASQAKLQVINPCKTIQCCHLHVSKIRDYPAIPYPKGKAITVPASKL